MRTFFVKIGIITGVLVIAMFLLGVGPFQTRYTFHYAIGHRVTSGETLWTIAQKYEGLQDKERREFIFDIREYNGITPLIQPGQVIEIPIYKKIEYVYSMSGGK